MDTMGSIGDSHPALIISLTSYPARIHAVSQVLESLYSQTMHPDRILLWLAEEQFPRREADLPQELLADATAGKFELRWCDDLGSHKKYYYTMQEFPEDIVVLVDDDTIYRPDTLETLYDAHQQNPSCIVALVAKLIMFDQNGGIKPYKDWQISVFLPFPSLRLVTMGGKGVLYPPHALSPNVFDKEAILAHCRYKGVICGDDMWLKMHSVLARTPTVVQKKLPLSREIQGLNERAIGSLSVDQIQHEQVLRFLLNRRSANGGPTAGEILLEYEKEAKRSGVHPEDDYIASSYIDDVISDYVSGLQRRLSKPEGRQDEEAGPVTAGYLLYRLRHTYGRLATEEIEASQASIKKLQEAFLCVPQIETIAKKHLEIRAFLEHGAPLFTNLSGRFRRTADYMYILKNWKAFLAAHPSCDKEYWDGYACFLVDTKRAYRAAESRGYFPDEAALLKEVHKTNWQELSTVARAKANLRGIYRVGRDEIASILPVGIKKLIRRLQKRRMDV